jgi:hypothetical protein
MNSTDALSSARVLHFDIYLDCVMSTRHSQVLALLRGLHAPNMQLTPDTRVEQKEATQYATNCSASLERTNAILVIWENFKVKGRNAAI